MAAVNLTNVVVLDNPTAFTNPFQFEVTFECLQPLDDDLEWKITYVGSAENETYDQVLEEVLVGPVPVGTNKFVFQANPPNPQLIPDEDLIGVTVVLVTCSYKEKEFVRVGYYVNNCYNDPEMNENPPPRVDLSRLQRNILADKPRVTRFPIDWNNADANTVTEPEGHQSIQNASMEDDEDILDCAIMDEEEDIDEEEEDDALDVEEAEEDFGEDISMGEIDETQSIEMDQVM